MLNNFPVKTAYTFNRHDHMSVFSLLENMMSRLWAFGVGLQPLLNGASFHLNKKSFCWPHSPDLGAGSIHRHPARGIHR